jgi:adenylate cyclase
VVDKFIGDAVMAAWGSLRGVSDEGSYAADARDAIRSALNMRVALEELNRGWVARGMQALHIGIGIHQGPVVVGNIGSADPHEKMDFTVIGDAVNLASRLEGTTKAYGVDIIVSEAGEAAGGARLFVENGRPSEGEGEGEAGGGILCAGRRGPRRRLWGSRNLKLAWWLIVQDALRRPSWELEKAAAAGLDDVLTREYLRRSRSLQAEPPADWDGVYTMTSK